MRGDDQHRGRERGQRVLDRHERVGVADGADRVHPSIAEPGERLGETLLRVRDRPVGIGHVVAQSRVERRHDEAHRAGARAAPEHVLEHVGAGARAVGDQQDVWKWIGHDSRLARRPCDRVNDVAPGSGPRLVERALEERREHDLRLRARDAGVVADALERLLQMRGVARAHVEHRARLARDGVGGLDLGMVLDAPRAPRAAAIRPSQ